MTADLQKTEKRVKTKASIAMLGGLCVRDPEGRPLSLPTAKVRLLAAYLAMNAGQPQARAKLCSLIWPDRGEEQARASLRNALSALRAALGDEAVIADRDSVMLSAGQIETDVDRLNMLTSAPETAGIGDLALYSAPFLDGFEVNGELAREWCEFEATRCRNLAGSLFEALALRLSGEGDEEGAISVGQQLLALDPYRERSHRLLMRLFAAHGERSLALAQYQKCRQLLKEELGVEPSSQTAALALELAKDAVNGENEAAPAPAPSPAAPAVRSVFDARISIAVLPFVYPSEDQDQQFVAEGLAEDLIAELTRLKDFLVIARQSSFALGAGPHAAQKAAEALDVRYILTGNLRRLGDTLSIGVQLIDTTSRRNVWAERYSRPLSEIFALQDEIIGHIMAEVDAEVRLSERERAARKPPDNMDAWELFHRGLWHVLHFTGEDIATAESLFRRAAGLSPGFALAEAGSAYAALVRIHWNMTDDLEKTTELGLAHARQAVSLDGTNPFSRVVLGRLLMGKGDLAHAFDELRMAIELNPSYAHAYYGMGQAQFWAGLAREALPNIERAMRLSPRDPLTSMFMTVRAFCLLLTDDLEAAEASARAGMAKQAREGWSRVALTAILVESGRIEEARATIAEARALVPNLSRASVDAFSRSMSLAVRDRINAALGKAGFN